jgi:hypothetical protein
MKLWSPVHSLDFINKACECLDLMGWEHANAILPSVVGQMVAAPEAQRRPRLGAIP